MRKFTLFLVSLFLSVGAMAQTTQKVEIALTTTAGQPGYISSPHDHAVINPTSQWDKGGIAALIDNNPSTHFHTAWENVPAGPHYFQVDLGEGKSIQDFCFDYISRGGDAGDDFPSQFTIKGSNDDSNYEQIAVVNFTMPNTAAEARGKTYSSENLSSEKSFRYLRFEVTNTKSYNGASYRVYFHAAEFNLYALTTEKPVEYTITYNYKQDNVLIGSISHSVVQGSEFPALVSGLYNVTVNDSKPTGTVQADGEYDIDVTIGEMPFEYYASVGAIPANGWYNLVMHSNHNTGNGTERYRTYVGAGNTEKLAWGENKTLTNAGDDYYWAFVGDPINGFRVVNKSAEGKILSSNGTANPVLLQEDGLANGYNTTWSIAARKYNVNQDGDYVKKGDWFCLKHASGEYMNANAGNGTVAFWTDNDNGSAVLAVKPLEINAVADVATYFSETAISIPAELGAEVYYASGINEAGYMGLEPITGIVAPETGIVVRYETDENITFAPEIVSPGTATAPQGNLLKGTTKKTLFTKEAGKSYYALGLVDGVVGFYIAVNNENEGEFYNNAFKAYLEMPAQQGTAAFYGFDWAGTTGISEVKGENGEVKAIYDLTGRKVNEITAPGIYIVNGKKVLVK